MDNSYDTHCNNMCHSSPQVQKPTPKIDKHKYNELKRGISVTLANEYDTDAAHDAMRDVRRKLF